MDTQENTVSRPTMGMLVRRIAALVLVLSLVAMSACGGSDSSSLEDKRDIEKNNKELVARFIDEFKNNANHDIVDELLASDFVHHLTDPRLPPGRDAIKLLGQSIVAGFPDVQATVGELLADGDLVVERTTARATNTGEFNGIPATGNQVTWTEIHIYRLKDGKIVEQWSEIDLLGLLTQIGAIPAP